MQKTKRTLKETAEPRTNLNELRCAVNTILIIAVVLLILNLLSRNDYQRLTLKLFLFLNLQQVLMSD